jgi:hypothetical protein
MNDGITTEMLTRQMMSAGGYHARPQDEDTMSVRSQDETARFLTLLTSLRVSLLTSLSLHFLVSRRLMFEDVSAPPLTIRRILLLSRVDIFGCSSLRSHSWDHSTTP